jgi:hypothetical protein
LSSSSGTASVVTEDERASHSGSCGRLRSPAVALAKRERRESFRRPAAGVWSPGTNGLTSVESGSRIEWLWCESDVFGRPVSGRGPGGGGSLRWSYRILGASVFARKTSVGCSTTGGRRGGTHLGESQSVGDAGRCRFGGQAFLPARATAGPSGLGVGTCCLSLRRRVDGSLGCHREELHRFGGVAIRGASVQGEVVSAAAPSG